MIKEKIGNDRNLTVSINRGELQIRIGISTLSWAAKHDEERFLLRTGKIVDEISFAKDTIYEIIKEDEVGNSLITKLLDEAMLRAIENGSIGIKYFKIKK